MIGHRHVMGCIVTLTLAIALHAVQKMVIFAHFIEEIAQILNEGSARNDAQHLHAAAQAQHGDIMVQTIGHRQVFRHITRGIGGTVVGDTVPRLRNSKQRRADVTATQKDDSLNACQQVIGISTMIGHTLYNVGILLT